ncbi:MAG: tetratricopeptide repeat protein [Candidatus Sulfotelmatobacter sp.]
MGVRKGQVLLLAAILATGEVAGAQATGGSAQSSSPSSSQNTEQAAPGSSAAPPPATGSSSSKAHHKTTHHTEVVEEVEGPPPELTKAEGFIQKQDFAQAQPLLRKVVESDATNYVAWFDLGFVENGLGHTEESIAAYRKSVEAKPDVFESNLNLGLQLAKSGQADAEKYLRAATQLKPTSHVAEGKARAWLSLARVEEATKPEEAIAAYREAAALQPKDAEAHLGAGLLLEKDGKFADAEQEYKAAQALDPASMDAVIGLANIYMRGRRFPQAEAELRRVLAAHPEQAAAHIQLGRVLAAEGKNDEAISELEAGAKLDPADVSLQRELADLYATAGKNEQAEAMYRTLIAAHPNDADLHERLGQSLLRGKKFGDAQQEFLMAVKLKPDLGTAYGDLAFAASENKDYVLTLKALDVRAKLLPEIPITYFLRATAYDHLRDAKKATENYRLFLQAADGKYPEQEWQAKHRLIALEPKR